MKNTGHFPDDFIFELTDEELENLRCQLGTSSWGGVRYISMAFTEKNFYHTGIQAEGHARPGSGGIVWNRDKTAQGAGKAEYRQVP